MRRVLLVSLAAMAAMTLTVKADEEWHAISTWLCWDWAKKAPTASPVPVKINIVRWADITFCPDQPKELVLHQISGTDEYEGCVCLEVCVNFAGLYINAEYIHDYSAIKLKDGGKKFVSLTAAGDPTNYAEDATTYHLSTLQLTGNLKALELCVKLTNLDMQSRWTVGDAPPVQIGQVKLTMWPSGAP